MSALDELVAAPRLFREEWPTEPLTLTSPRDMSELFGTEDAKHVISIPALQAREMGMVRNGAHTGAALDATHETDTLVLNGLHLTYPALSAFTKALSAEFGHQVTANVYRTPAHSKGYGPHFDTHHVFLAQTEGEKYWRLNRPTFPAPLSRHPWTRIGFTAEQHDAFTNGAPDFECMLTAGHVLFIPRGWIHHGTTLGTHSMHITFGVQLLTVHWVVEQIVDVLASQPEFRTALPPDLSRIDFAELVGRVGGDLVSWLTQHTQNAHDGLVPRAVRSAQQVAVLGLGRTPVDQ